jgi:chromosome segregation ATPase
MTDISATDKENFQEPQNTTTPHGSPSQANKMWDSNDPLRNPPPLPVSPQMLKIKNTNISRSGSPGKLSFVQSDNIEIDYQLKKVLESQTSLKKIIQGIDNSVKHTQLDLDSLVSRSSNNNSHLKDLLQNVMAANGSTLTEDKIRTLLNDLEKSVSDNLVSLEKATNTLADSISVMKDEKLQGSVELKNDEIHQKLSNLARSIEDKSQFDTLSQNIEEQKRVSTAVQEALNESLNLIKSVSAEVDEKFNSLGIDSHFDQSNKNQRELLMELAKLTNNRNNILKLEEIEKAIKSNDEKLLQSQDVQKSVISEKLHETSNNIIASFSKTINDSFSTNESNLSRLQSEISASVEAKYQTEINSKNLELQIKDKKIEELERQLAEQAAKQEISESLVELVTKNAKLETRYESLNEAYARRYKEFQQLYSDHNELITIVSNTNMDKLTTIIGTATISNYAPSTTTSPRKQAVSNRVMSTNSYLNHTNLGTPKGVKTYDLDPVESDDAHN